MKSKLTPFFPMNIKPVHIGVYLVQPYNHNGYKYYSKWNGKYWNFIDVSIQGADSEKTKSISCHNGQVIGWRGLTRG
jgi:hypothetical protein